MHFNGKKILSSFMALAVSLTAVQPVFAVTGTENQNSDILYENHFNEENALDGWNANGAGTFEVADDNGNPVLHISGSWFNPYYNADWKDYSLEFDFKLNDYLEGESPEYHGLEIGSHKGSVVQQAVYRTTQKEFQFLRTPGGYYHDYNQHEYQYELEQGKYYTARLDISGTNYAFYFKEQGAEDYGEPYFQCEMDKEANPGGFSIGGAYTDMYIDNICVRSLAKNVPITGIDIQDEPFTLGVGGMKQLTSTVSPADTTEKAVWKSADSSIAEVSDTGLVTAVKEGNTEIILESPDGSVQDSVAVTVTKSDGEHTVLYENDFEGTDPLASLLKLPFGGGYNSAQSSSVVTDGAEHEKVWELKAASGSATSYGCYYPSGLGDQTLEFDLKTDSTTKDEAPFVGLRIAEGASEDKAYIVHLYNDSITIGKGYEEIQKQSLSTERGTGWNHYKINVTGFTITVWMNGEEIISWTDPDATYGKGGFTFWGWRHTVLVDNIVYSGLAPDYPMTGIEIEFANPMLTQGKELQLEASLEPQDTTEKPVWESSDPEIAAVDANGLVTGKKEGKAVITARNRDGKISDEFEVTVYAEKKCETFLYVAPNGSDSTGTGTEDQPFQTLERAREEIRAIKKAHNGEVPDGGITVYLREGEYYQEETFELTQEDSGKAGSPVVFTSYPGENASIHSGKAIEGWELLKEDNSQVNEAAKGKLYVADIEKGWRFHDLYVNGIRQQVSRQTNSNVISEWKKLKSGVGKFDPEKGQPLTFPDGELDGLEGNPDIELALCPVVYWNTISVLADINEETNTAYNRSYNPATFWDGQFDPGYEDAGAYNILNALKYLDEPGEWCVDSVAGKVYWWPEDDTVEGKQVVAPKAYEVIRFQGQPENPAEGIKADPVSFITLEGLTIEYSDRIPEDQWDLNWIMRNSENPDAAVFLQNTSYCKIENCVISNTGTYAVAVDQYGQFNEILHNEMADLGCGGVELFGYGPGTLDVSKCNTVSYNYMHDLGRAPYFHSAAVSVYGSNHNDVRYNYIQNVPYAAFSVAGASPEDLTKKEDGSHPVGGGAFDSFGTLGRQYQIRWDELPVSDYNSAVEADTRRSKQYLHSEKNMFEYNIVEEYMMQMDDGGCLYTWGGGEGNEFNYNAISSSRQPRHWAFPIYFDNYTVDGVAKGNRISARFLNDMQGNTPSFNNTFEDNQRAAYPDKPAGFDELCQEIKNQVEAAYEGGYLMREMESPVLVSPSDSETGVELPAELVWSPVRDAVSYTYQLSADKDFTQIAVEGSTEENRVTLYDLDYETVYYWRVKAEGKMGESDYSPAQTFEVGEMQLPHQVQGLKADRVMDKISLQWEMTLCEKYAIYRRTSNDSQFVKIGETSGETYTDTGLEPGTVYQYYVVACNELGEGEPSQHVSVPSQTINWEFKDDFSDADYSKANWKKSDGTLVGDALLLENDRLIFDDRTSSWIGYLAGDSGENVVVEAEFHLDDYKEGTPDYTGFGLILQDNVQFLMRLNGKKVELVQNYEGSNWRTMESVETDLMADGTRDFTFRVECVGDLVNCYINGELLISWRDTQGWLTHTGCAGISVGTEILSVDNIKMTGFTQEELPAVDKTELEALYNEYKDLENSGYTAESWKVLKQALKTAENVLKDETAFQEDVAAAAEGLRQAVDGLRAEKSNLKDLLEEARRLEAEGKLEGVVESAVKAFYEAVENAEAVMKNEKAVPEEVKDTCRKLLLAIHGLGIYQGDKTALKEAVELAEGLDLSLYVEVGQKEFQQVLKKAKEVLENGDATEEIVEEARQELMKAMAALRLKADKSALEKLLEELEKMDLNQYTKESVSQLEKAMVEARAVMQDEGLSEDDQAVVDEAVKKLEKARDSLEKRTGSEQEGDSPATGDNGAEVAVLGLLVVSGMFLLRKRRVVVR